MNIQGQAALITGASRGLGKELAKALARRGAKVVLVARGDSELRAVVQEIRAEGGEAHGLPFDVGDKDAIYRIAGAAAALVGPPTIVIHNASTLGPVPMPFLADTECEDFERVLAVNLVGPFRLTKALVGSMVLRQKGTFVFVSSDAAVSAYSRWGAYGISKAAQDHLARTFAAEIEPVRFLSIDPGEMNTAMYAAANPDADVATLARPADVAARIVEILASADSIPNGARVLASDFAVEDKGAVA